MVAWSPANPFLAPPDPDPVLRFFDMVLIADADGCWPWAGTRGDDGYGQFTVDGVKAKAHRHAYELLVGPIPKGLTLDHLCRNRACVNPAHLEPVTLAENILRGESPTAINARKTHCPQGHEYTTENTRIDRKGWRECRRCASEFGRARKQRYLERMKAVA